MPRRFPPPVPGALRLAAAVAACLLVSSGVAFPADGLRDWLGPAFPPEKVAEAESLLGGLALSPGEGKVVREGVGLLSGGGFSPGAVIGFLDLCGRLNTAGISPLDLVSKVREGMAKKADPARLEVVLRDRAGRLLQGRVLVLDLASEGVVFLDQQMAYRVVADYLARGISSVELRDRAIRRNLEDFPALDNVIR